MRDFTIARKYAQSLFSKVKEKGLQQEDIGRQISDILKIMTEEMTHFLIHPVISLSEKIKVLDNLFPKMDKLLFDFLKLLISAKRIGLLKLIQSIYDDLLCESKNVRKIIVETAFEISSAQQQFLVEGLKKRFGSEVLVNYVLCPELISGIIIKSDEFVLDNSIKSRLRQLKQNYSEKLLT